MTAPITPDPSIHDASASTAPASATSDAVLQKILQVFAAIPEVILQQVVNFIKETTGVDLTGIAQTIENAPQEAIALLEQIPILGALIKGGEEGLTALWNMLLGIGAVGTTTPVAPSQYAALAEGASPNKLRDPDFSGPTLVEGQSNWMWDAPAVPHRNSVRTVRNGLITVYYVGGTYTDLLGNDPVSFPFEQWNWMGIPTDVINSLGGAFPPGVELDTQHFEFINIPYPGSNFPQDQSIQNGIDYCVALIKAIPGKFILTGVSQGANVCSGVYDELRTGKITDRLDDLLLGIVWGNPRKQQGITFKDDTYGVWPDPTPTKSGIDMPNLANCDPDVWYELYHALDITSCCENDPKGVNYGRDQYARLEEGVMLEQYNGIADIILSGPIGWIEAFQAFEAIYNDIFTALDANGELSPHHQFWSRVFQPFGTGDVGSGATGQGDYRCAAEIMIDKINSFAPLVTPPVVGELHEIEGESFAVSPYQVVDASADTFWIGVDVPNDYVAIQVGVNAYDASGNLIGTVTSEAASITGPVAYQIDAINIGSSFVMPEGTATARIVCIANPETMTSGIVWFANATFEISSLIDSALLANIQNIPQLDATSVSGPLGIADMLTAFQNLIDGQASALGQTGLTDVQLSALFSSQGQNAIDTSHALDLAVQHEQILTNVTQPVYTGLQPTGEVTFPLTSFPQGTVMPYTTVSSGTALAGVITCQQAASKGFVEFLAQGTGTGVNVNVYSVDPTTGLWTLLWASADISASVPASFWGYVSVTIPSPYVPVTQGERVFVEIATTGMDIKVASIVLPTPNNLGTIPPNLGATRTLASTGGTSPSTIVQAALTFSAEVPYICFGIKNVAAVYQPPDRAAFTAAGVNTYALPAWVAPGNLIDAVALGGGGSGGTADGSWTVYNGQGGTGGSWAGSTFHYGVDIPDGTTELLAIVGPGCASRSGDGGTTVIGYGTLATPAYSATGVGGYSPSGTTLFWDHTANEGDYVVAVINTGWGTFDVKYDGVPMIPLGLVYDGNSGPAGAHAAYGLPDAPGGTKTIVVTLAQSAAVSGVSTSHSGIASAGKVTSTFGAAGTPMSQTVDIQDGQLVVQSFGIYSQQLTAFGGGTERTYRSGAYALGVSLSDATADTTFTATPAASDSWSAIAIALNPKPEHVLLTATGGKAGGPGGSANYNPLNTNATASGLGPGTETWVDKTYFGGSNVAVAQAGSTPGGGSGGGTAAVFGAESPPLAGADGGGWFTARQS